MDDEESLVPAHTPDRRDTKTLLKALKHESPKYEMTKHLQPNTGRTVG